MSLGNGIREFRWGDLTELTSLFNDVNDIASTERAYDVELMGQFLSQPACKPEENCFLATADGSLVGFTLITPELAIGRTVASGGVVESYRNRGTGRALLETAVIRAKALSADVLHVQVSSDSEAGGRLLSGSGFRVVRKYSLLRWHVRDIAAAQLPQGFSIRSLRPGLDEEALTSLQNAAFGGSWGFCPNTVEDIVARLKFKTCDPRGVIFVAHDDDLASYNWTVRAGSPTSTVGCISMTGVHPDYRGQRIGKAVVLAGMEYLAASGVRTIELEVDDQNSTAKEIYSEIGFETVRRTLWYERTLSG